ncbi:hypothetical protein C2845_PM13G03870 [Panicum miliaceum]|uniref:Uncharacterized protein n=1 Tax=Panicum miliaceum TaxID=4540 RepID=A0A3L6RKU4_PANMI|nr:hypothetical protein C2845_PM13G03870 [Panicum miliaceum]
MVEGLVVKNHGLAALIKLAAILMLGLTIALYVMYSQYCLESDDLPVALGLIAFMTVYFVVTWRLISYYKVVFLEEYVMSPRDVDTSSEITSEKMSTLV